MIVTQILFLTNDISDIEVYLPQAPKKGETFVFPFITSTPVDFKVKDIEWVFDEYNKFSKIRVYLEED
jgi:hypothetical protein